MLKKLLLLLSILIFQSLHAAPKDIGILLLHGKWGHPNGLRTLATELERQGYKVVLPLMPWASVRNYDVDYSQALAELDEQVKILKDNGITQIVVGGQSLGANAALAYAATRSGVYGVAALAPGHTPDRSVFFKTLTPDFEKSQKMIKEGRGAEKFFFDDINQGQKKSIYMSANSYASYFDPQGLGAMPRSASMLSKTTALLLVIGEKDGLIAVGEDYIYNVAPKNSRNRYVIIKSDHMNTAATAAPVFIQWLESLAQ